MVDAVGTTHHVKINGQFYLVRPGTYRKRPAPLFGSRFTTGDPDYNNLSFWQHWVQHCWVGGFGAEAWQDDAMFDQGAGIDATQHEVMVLSRDLGPQNSRDSVGNWDLTAADGDTRREFIYFNQLLYCLSFGLVGGTPPSRLFKWNTGTQTWVLVNTFSQHVESMEQFGRFLFFGDAASNFTKMSAAEAFTTVAKPGGITATPSAMKTYRGFMYVNFENAIYRLKPDFTWDGSTAFYTAQDVDNIRCMEPHLGFLYMSSNNGHILRTDGNSTFDIWQFDGSVNVVSLRSFDGRLFVACTETLDGTTAQQAVIYQFTGAAVTELKRWGKEGQDISTGKMRVIGHRLYFGAASLMGMGNGFGIGTYDPVEDAYHMWAVNKSTGSFPGGTEGIKWTVDDVFFYRGYIWCSVRGYGIFRAKFSFKDVTNFLALYDTTAAGGSPGSKNGGWYESSDFDAGTPGLQKLWNGITIFCDLPNSSCSIYVEYSLDGGQTWTVVGTVSHTGPTRYARLFKLGTGTPKVGVKGTRFKYRLTLRTTDSTRSPQLRGVVVRYLPIPEPGWQWDMQVVLSENQELLDGTQVEYDATAISNRVAALETPFRTQLPVHFIDIDGTEWDASGDAGVLVMNYVYDSPLPGPNSDGVRERLIQLSLVETSENYT